MMSKKIFLAVSILVVAAMILAACAPAAPEPTEAPPEPEMTEEPVEPEPEPEEPAEPEPEPEEPAEPEPEPTEEEMMEETRGVLRYNTGLAYGGLENLNPVDPNRFWPPIALLWDRLTAPLEGELKPGPSLATSWESNETADVWTFYLRDDVFFHDGSQLTSADVVYSFDHWVNGAESVIAGSFGVVDSVEAPDDFTVVFNLNQPSVDFPLTVMDYRARVFKEGTIPDIWETGMGSGPFKLDTLDVEGITVLTANDDYWDGPPGVAAIEVFTIADVEAAIQATLAGQIDFSIDLIADHVALFEGNPDYTVDIIPTGNWSGFVMRTDIPPFDNLALRQAMHLVVDRQEMLDLALSGYGAISCDQAIMPGDPYLMPECLYERDVEAAKAKLAEAGYADGFEIDLYTADVCTDWTALTEIYQQQAAEAGITVNISNVSADGFWSEQWMVEPFVMTCWNERTAQQALNEIYRGGGSWNESYWNVAEFDALLDAALAETDFDTRRQHYLDAQEMLHLDGGTIIPYYTGMIRAAKTCVENLPDIGLFFADWHHITKPADCE
jgi:peptide/nickel transport system substrate-binding protein